MNTSLRLNESHQELLEHAYLYRMLLPELMPEKASAVDELVRQAVLAKACLYGQRQYYYLTAKARPYFADKHFRPGPLSESEKIREFAMIGLCFFDHCNRRRKLTPDDFDGCLTRQQLQQLGRYYLHERPGEPSRIGYLRVDQGGRGRWDRLLCRIRRDILRHRDEPTYGQMIDDGLFEFAVVTVTEEKASRLEQALQEHPVSTHVPVIVRVIPELLSLIAPPPIEEPHLLMTSN